jgi:hypothetical protein
VTRHASDIWACDFFCVVPTQNCELAEKLADFPLVIGVRSGGIITILSALLSMLSFRFLSRASLELELVALRHQLIVLRRQRAPPASFRQSAPMGVPLSSVAKGPRRLGAHQAGDGGQWHRKGFRIYWRWRSRRSGRPKTSAEIRALIRRMSRANPLWGAPRIHGQLLKLGIEVSQATVGRHLPRRRNAPSPTWRSFPRNHMTAVATVDMFVVATATFKLLYAVIVLNHHRRRVIHFDGHPKPDPGLARAANHRGLSLGHRTAVSATRPRHLVWC